VFTVYDNLNEIVELLLEHFNIFLPAQNEIDGDEWTIDIPDIPISFILLDSDNSVTINRQKYVFAATGPLISGEYLITGYFKQQWVKRSPIIVYPVFYDGEYDGEFYLTKKEREERARELVEACREM
jgi:hypothetical protein